MFLVAPSLINCDFVVFQSLEYGFSMRPNISIYRHVFPIFMGKYVCVAHSHVCITHETVVEHLQILFKLRDAQLNARID